nr:hypothetical protein GCM10010200_054150 [Actinomadura rugatobispora]
MGERTYRATRSRELTAYQRAWGALPEVQAASQGELWVLCDAQTRLAERLAVAEAQRARTGPPPELPWPASRATRS